MKKESEVCNEAKRETHIKKTQTEVCASGDPVTNYTTFAVIQHQLDPTDNAHKTKDSPLVEKVVKSLVKNSESTEETVDCIVPTKEYADVTTEVCKAVNRTESECEKVTVHYDNTALTTEETCHYTDKSESTADNQTRMPFKHCEPSPTRRKTKDEGRTSNFHSTSPPAAPSPQGGEAL